MADFDIYNDKAPYLKQTSLPTLGKPTISQLKAAIAGSGVSSSYPAAKMFQMTKNDLIAIVRQHGITVNTTL